MVSVPKWVATDPFTSDFRPGGTLPIIGQGGTYVTDQPTLDAIIASAAAQHPPITLYFTDTDPSLDSAPVNDLVAMASDLSPADLASFLAALGLPRPTASVGVLTAYNAASRPASGTPVWINGTAGTPPALAAVGEFWIHG